MPVARARPAYLIVEALCALALLGVIAATAGLVLSSARRALAERERRDAASRTERETIEILERSLVSGDGVVLRGDTAVEFDQLIGTGVLCATESRALYLPLPTGSAGSLTQWLQRPIADDVIAVHQEAPGLWWYATVDSVQDRFSAEPCGAAAGWRPSGAAALRLTVWEDLPPNLPIGGAVRLLRRGRFTLYHAGSGDWMLGWRRCHPWLELCGTVQPVAGPLRAPSVPGLRFTTAASPSRLEIIVTAVEGGGARGTIYW